MKVSEGRSYYRMDIIWSEIKKSLPKWANIALFLLTIPHSNAGEERIFSIIGKNKTKFRSNLDNKTLNSIMLIKINKPVFQIMLPMEIFKRATKKVQGRLQRI